MRGKSQSRSVLLTFALAGGVFVVWLGVKLAPAKRLGLVGLLKVIGTVFQEPFNLEYCSDTFGMVIFLLLLYIAGMAIWYMSARQYRRGEEYGSANWGSPSSIKRRYCDQKHPEQNLILTRKVAIGSSPAMIYKHGLNTNVIVIGGSGSGKTRGYVIPNLLQASMSYVVLDPSGEILRATGNFLKTKGYEIKCLNLFEMEKSDGYNPFIYLRNDDDVEKMVNNYWRSTMEKGATKGEQIWDDTARELLAALCYYLFYFAPPSEQNFAMVQYLVRNMQGPNNPVDRLFQEVERGNPEHIAIKHYRAYHSGSEKTLQSIQITLISRLSKFNLSSVEKLSSTTEDALELFEIPQRKTVIFAVTPVADTSFNFFVSLLYTQLFDILYEYGNTHGHLKVPLHFLMDEFANVTLPEDFENRLATFRKYHISASIILQDISQIEALFEKQWKGIVGNTDTMLYLGGNEDSTHELLSKRLGKQTIRTNTFGQTKGRMAGFSKNEQQLGRELLTPDEVRMLNNRYALLFIRGERPIQDRKYNLKSHPNITETAFGHGQEYEHQPSTKAVFYLEPVFGLTQQEIDQLPELDLSTGKLVYPK